MLLGNDLIVEEFFNNQQEYYKKNNPVIKIRKEIILKLLGDQVDKEIIDIGSGNGEISLNYLENNKISYLDISANLLNIIKEKIPEHLQNKTTYINENILTFSTNKKYDITLCIGLFAHINKLDALIDKLSFITKTNGLIILQFTDSSKLFEIISYFTRFIFKKNSYTYNINRTKKIDILKLLKDTNLEIIKSINHWPIFPYFSLFPQQIKLSCLRKTYNNSFLSNFGSEIIMLLQKANNQYSQI